MFGKKMPKDYVIPQDHDPVYNYPLPPLSEFLETKKGALYFELYLKENKCEENLSFYQAVQEFKQKHQDLSKEAAKEEAERIWKLFIDPSELTCINIPGEIAKTITKQKGTKSRVKSTIFDDAQSHVLALMFNNYGKFRRTPYFEDWLKDSEKKKPKDLRNKWYKEFGQLDQDQLPKPTTVKLQVKPEST